MDLGNFFRGFFGLRQPPQDRCDDCRKWPEESCKVTREHSIADDPFSRDSHFFNIARPMDPFSIFEHMEDVFKNFFSFHSSRMWDFPSMEEPFNEHENSPRRFLLDPSERNFGDFWGDNDHSGHIEVPNIESFSEPRSPRDLVLKPSYQDSPKSVESTPHRDSDLDDAQAGDILHQFPQRSQPTLSFRKSVSTRIIRGSDGTIEEHRTVKDSSGKEVTTVRKSIGDQSYSVTLHMDKEGINEKKEDFVNLDEKDVPDFQERWHKIKDNNFHISRDNLLQEPNSLIQSPAGDENFSSIFRKLFKF